MQALEATREQIRIAIEQIGAKLIDDDEYNQRWPVRVRRQWSRRRSW
jgi:hypothetical protein